MTIVSAQITTKWNKGYTTLPVTNVEGFSIDGAMDTDTDAWTIQIGDVNNDLRDVLRRDNEVRLSIFSLGDGKIETLHSGFADEITLDQNAILTFQGRDITAVAVDSQHPPQIWHSIRPQVLVAREARALKIGDRLRLTAAKGFKKYVTDGSESYWQVWYRFYRKRRMWVWAEPDASLNAGTLNYNQNVSYYFGAPIGTLGSDNPRQWIPVEELEYRSSKRQRVGDVFYFGHRGDIGFVARASDPSTREWIKRPTLIISSGHVHNQAEARVEAWEEIFESKVGAVEIQLTVSDPGFIIRQNRMAMVNIPQIGLRGEYFVVGNKMVGSVDSGFYQVVRLREKSYAVSRRKPDDPALVGSDVAQTTMYGTTGIAANLGVRWKWFFTAAADKYRGPWAYDLFLGVLLAICEKESGFRNFREGGGLEYPGTADGKPPSIFDKQAWNKFVTSYANDPSFGRVNKEYGVGPMQLTTVGYKRAADRLGGTSFDELGGGRWEPRWNIMAAAAALASKLGAGWSISPDGVISKTPISGYSLQPNEKNIWGGVRDYNGAGRAADAYAVDVRNRYENTYKTVVSGAITAARNDHGDASVPQGSSNELRQRVLTSKLVQFTKSSQRDDIRYGLIDNRVLQVILWVTEQGFPVVITALKSDHSKLTTKGRISAHGAGKAVDMGNYGLSNKNTAELMRRLGEHQAELGFAQLIGPVDNLVIPLGIYDSQTLHEHDTHIHVGFAL